MRPRSRLPSKRTPLLPTIREGTEETVREMNDANTAYSSTHRRPLSSSEDYFLSICHLAHPTFPTRDVACHAQDGRFTSYGQSDPLENLYGHPGGTLKYGRKYTRSNERKRAHSIPNTSNPDLTPQRKSSCPEIHSSSTSQNGCLPKTDIAAVMEEEEEDERQDPGSIKPSLISQWISDCRSAWREARARACLLPAIAEI